jgi:glycosyltransferase involved in cell wall biosynthesis
MQANREIFLSIVMPAYNEEANIERVVQDHLAVARGLEFPVTDWEVVVLDDGSSDKTADVLRKLADQTTRLRVVGHIYNQGLYRAFDDVHHAAKGTHVYSTGSDGQWPAMNLQRLLRVLLEREADLVVGVRPNRNDVYSWWRSIVSYCHKSIPRLLLGVKTHDPGSIKLGRRELFQCPLVSRSPFMEAERVIAAVRGGYRVEFAAIEFLPRTGGKARGAKWSYILGSLYDCFRCFWYYRLSQSAPLWKGKSND